MTRALVLAALSFSMVAIACGLDVSGAADGVPDAGDDASVAGDAAPHDATSSADVTDAATFDAASSDATTPSDGSQTVCSPLGTTSCFALPNGWTPVAYASTQTSPCASPYGTTADVEEGPTPNAACQCETCAITTSPSCVTGAISTAYDNDLTHLCLLGGATLANNPSGSCVQGSWMLASGGACTAPIAKHKEAFTFASKGRMCSPPNPQAVNCHNGICAAPAAPSPYAVCIAAQGAQGTCPSGPFSVRHVVGTDVSFDCAGGACGCSVSAQCTSPSVTFYQDQQCLTTGVTIVADDACHASGVGGGSNNNFVAYEYRATPSNVGCTTMAPAPASNVQLVGTTTICCAQ
jgi:hypothetical protein